MAKSTPTPEAKTEPTFSTLQKKAEVGGTSQIHQADNRPQAAVQRKLHAVANNSSRVQQLQAIQRMANRAVVGKATPIQKQADPEVKSPNNTRLPDTLKSGIESLSGHSMDDVKVHYNSAQPAQLSAHAYAQRTDIHLGPGQEKHLPHEAWHVVQQKQGRVKPTLQMKTGVMVNDDVGLEREADEMGAKAQSDPHSAPSVTTKVASTGAQAPIQRAILLPGKQLDTQSEVENLLANNEEIGWDDRWAPYVTELLPKDQKFSSEKELEGYLEKAVEDQIREELQDDAKGLDHEIETMARFPILDRDSKQSKLDTLRLMASGSGSVVPQVKPKAAHINKTRPQKYDEASLFPDELEESKSSDAERISALGIKQGNLGDCWLISTIGAVALKMPNHIKSIIREVNIRGVFRSNTRIFRIMLTDPRNGALQEIFVDTQLPTSKKTNQPFYAGYGLETLQLYAPLIEKAIAYLTSKYTGYASITSSGAQAGFTWLTGQPPVEIQLKPSDIKRISEKLKANKSKPMTISGRRKNPPPKASDSKSMRFEPHDMVVAQTDGVHVVIYDQSARTGYRTITATLSKLMVKPFVHGVYEYSFDKIAIGK
ncbi:MAG TPA: hypothetical protein DCE41_23830 [Cytophagales bacterium]|nr:hypothetical protein [Cytophagales bacterium]HAA20049.1 hypothetical protein [Cytophagales bacterium]HAP62781.1 hypothetical protein [Cytophagales bacterium]